MKKLILLLTLLTMTVSLMACSEKTVDESETTTEAPTTTEPETEVPTTTEPETEVPTTTAPETEVPTTTEPETEVPTTTEPETEVPTTTEPETEVPTTTEPETEVPTTTEPETEVPTTTEPETEVPTTTVPETEVPDEVLSLEEIIALTYEATGLEFPRFMNSELTKENQAYMLGVDTFDFIEGIASEPMMTAQAHSFVLFTVEEGADIEGIKADIKANVDGRKWICVAVEDENIIVDNIGNMIVLIMDAESEAIHEALLTVVQ